MTTKSQIAALILRVGLGFWFTYSGGLKLFVIGLDRFTRDVANYQLVGPPFDAIAAYMVPWVELIAGLCLMLGLLHRGAILAIGGLVAVFTVAVGSAWIRQLDISCGCHGGDEPIRYWWKAAEFAFYSAALTFLWIGRKHSPISAA